jgi:NAD(P)-dependent dehydrogenase (short-subunit alcohol dehydrogenase family)
MLPTPSGRRRPFVLQTTKRTGRRKLSGSQRCFGMRVLVTGGGGFIGSHAVERLCRLGHEVRILDNFSTGSRANLVSFLDDVELIEGDIQATNARTLPFAGARWCFTKRRCPRSRSVQDPLTSNAANVVGTLHILLAARGTTFGASCSRPRSRRKDPRGHAVRRLAERLRDALQPRDRSTL